MSEPPKTTHTVAVDYGAKYIGIALVRHAPDVPNRALYAACVVAEPKPLKEKVQPRAVRRRLRRTGKTHRRRLRRLAQALSGIAGADAIVRFCRRRGYSYQPDEDDQQLLTLQVPRAEFFCALEVEIDRLIGPAERERVLRACRRHLNEPCLTRRELRPARFNNRGPSKCQWEGCGRNVPRASNATEERLRQALYQWLKPVFDELSKDSRDPLPLRRSLDHWCTELAGLARAYSRAEKLEGAAADARREALHTRRKRIYRNLCERIACEASEPAAAKFAAAWKKTFRANITELVTKRRGGRVPYCRDHSRQFVDYFLGGKAIPNRQDVAERDLAGRRQQIVFARLWRLIEARLLPLAGGRIDRVVVERAAFDVLAGKFKHRQKLSEEDAAEMYWRGPQFGFADRREMLQREFAGRCAYCGQPAVTIEAEHILPRSQFSFDSYFNVLPACGACNAKKGPRTAMAAGMKVDRTAYDVYATYVDGLKPPHLFHTIKKGLLNLFSRDGNSLDAEKSLGMLASNLVSMTRTQQAQRPLARYLAGKLAAATGQRPEVAHVAGRHTSLYRSIILPDYDKAAEKEEGKLANHAVDALVLGCRLPSAAAFENRQWYASAAAIGDWRERVRAAGPALADGLPAVTPVETVPHFETQLSEGYLRIDLTAFNRQRHRQSGHGTDPVGKTRRGLPIKRRPAADVLARLLGPQPARAKQIQQIAHAGLRELLASNEACAADRFVQWLQDSVRTGLATSTMGNHPSDQARRRLLEDFVATPAQAYVPRESGDRKAIPHIIGIRCLVVGQGESKFDVPRCDRHGKVIQHYMGQPRVRALYVGYRCREGQLNRKRPIVLAVCRAWAVEFWTSGRATAGHPLPDILAHGRSLGAAGSLREFLGCGQAALDEWCREVGIAKRFRIAQGAVVEKTDGTRFQIRNFDDRSPWLRGSPWRDIRRVYRSPLVLLRSQPSGNCGDDTARP